MVFGFFFFFLHARVTQNGGRAIVVFDAPRSDLYTVSGHNALEVGHILTSRGGELQAKARVRGEAWVKHKKLRGSTPN